MTTKVVTKGELIFRSAGSHTAPISASRVSTNKRASHRRTVPMFIPADQAYYWSSRWQRDEAESLADLKAGRSQRFANSQDAIRHIASGSMPTCLCPSSGYDHNLIGSRYERYEATRGAGSQSGRPSEMSPSTHQDSPRVPEWPTRIEVSCGSNICGDLIYSIEKPCPAPPNPDYNPETETYIPVSALLSDEVVEAAQVALERAAEVTSRRAMSGLGIPAAEAKALVGLLVDAETALRAAIEQVGGGRGGG